MTPQPLLERLITRYPRYCNVTAVRVTAVRVTAVLFGILVLGTVLLIGALSFLPVLALGPIAEYLKTAAGV